MRGWGVCFAVIGSLSVLWAIYSAVDVVWREHPGDWTLRHIIGTCLCSRWFWASLGMAGVGVILYLIGQSRRRRRREAD